MNNSSILLTLGVNKEETISYGVPQPSLATKDIIIIVFMFLLWAYSLLLTYKAWYKILYSDGDEGSNMWRFLMDVIKSKTKEVPSPMEQDVNSLLVGFFPIISSQVV